MKKESEKSNHVLIPKIAAKVLSNKELYTYFVLLFKSDYYTGESIVLQTRLSEITGYPTDTISVYLNKAKENGFINIETEQRARDKRKNIYNSLKPLTNFIVVNRKFLDLEIKGLSLKEQSEIKGFILMLKSICLNGSAILPYSYREITDKVEIGESTVKRLMKKCKELGFIIPNESRKGYLLQGDFFKGDEEFYFPPYTRKRYKEIYKEIAYFLIRKGINPPPYDESVIPMIAAKYYTEDMKEEYENVLGMLPLLENLEKRITISNTEIRHLNYIAQALLNHIPYIRRKKDDDSDLLTL